MSLVLAAKTIDEKLVLASDGRAIYDQGPRGLSISTDEMCKIQVISNDLVYTFTGKESSTYYAVLSHNLERVRRDNPRSHGPMEVLGRFCEEINTPVLETFGKDRKDSMNLHYFTFYRGTAYTAEHIIEVDGNKSYMDKLAPMTFPFRTGGIASLANETIVEMALRGEINQDEKFMQGLLYHLLSETSKTDNCIGGKFYMGSFTKEGYRLLTDRELLDIELRSHTIGEKLSRTPMTTNLEQMVEANRGLSHAVLYLRDLDCLSRISEKRIKMYKSTDDRSYLGAALLLLDAVYNIYNKTNVAPEEGIEVTFSLLGNVHELLGDKEQAKHLYVLAGKEFKEGLRHIDVRKREFLSRVRAVKGLVRLGVLTQQQANNGFAIMAEHNMLTKEEMDSID